MKGFSSEIVVTAFLQHYLNYVRQQQFETDLESAMLSLHADNFHLCSATDLFFLLQNYSA